MDGCDGIGEVDSVDSIHSAVQGSLSPSRLRQVTYRCGPVSRHLDKPRTRWGTVIRERSDRCVLCSPWHAAVVPASLLQQNDRDDNGGYARDNCAESRKRASEEADGQVNNRAVCD